MELYAPLGAEIIADKVIRIVGLSGVPSMVMLKESKELKESLVTVYIFII